MKDIKNWILFPEINFSQFSLVLVVVTRTYINMYA